MLCLSGNEKNEIEINIKQVLIFAGAIILVELSSLLLLKNFGKIKTTLIIRLFDLIFFILILKRFKLLKRLIKTDVKKGILKGIFISFCIGIIFFITYFIIKVTIGKSIFNIFLFQLPHKTKDIILLFLAGGVISPIAEEIFFRGLIYNWLRKNYHIPLAVIISALIFSFFHLKGTMLPLIQFAGGILFACAYEYSKSIYTSMVIHITGNIFIFMVPVLYRLEPFNKLFF